MTFKARKFATRPNRVFSHTHVRVKKSKVRSRAQDIEKCACDDLFCLQNTSRTGPIWVVPRMVLIILDPSTDRGLVNYLQHGAELLPWASHTGLAMKN